MTGFHFHTLLIARELGGASHIALHLAKYLRAIRERTHVWLPGAGAAWAEAERLGLPVDRFDASGAWNGSLLRSAYTAWCLGRQLGRRGPGLIHVHAPFVYGHLRRGLKTSGLKQVVHVHLDESEDGWRWAFKRPPDLIITCARFLAEKVRRTLPETLRESPSVVAVPNAVDTERFFPSEPTEAKRSVGAPASGPLLLMLANLAPHKGQETAVRAVAILKSRGRDVNLWLAGIERQGSTSFIRRLEQLIQELDVADRVRLLGQRGDAPELLRAADVFLLPSTQEGLPLSVLEAQATRVPVLAAPTAGVPEVVQDGRTGFLLNASDAEGYANRIELLQDNRGLAHQLQDSAHEQIKAHHTWTAYSEKIWSLYHEVTAGSGSAQQPARHHSQRPARTGFAVS